MITRTTHARMKMAVAIAVVAALALPGEAKTVDFTAHQPETAVAAITPAASGKQAAFGLFLDPHADPVLHIELPQGYWSL